MRFSKKYTYSTIHVIWAAFMFYSDDHEPVHVHIFNAGREAKYNVQPVKMVYNHGFKKHELSLIESLVEENVDVITERWYEFFKK